MKFKEMSKFYRIGVVGSFIWIFSALVITDPWSRQRSGSTGLFGFGERAYHTTNNWDGFILWGLLPVAILWGGVWIVNSKKE